MVEKRPRARTVRMPAQASSRAREPELNADNAVVLTKDGKHTIDYQVLVEERKGRRADEKEHWKSEAEAMKPALLNWKPRAAARRRLMKCSANDAGQPTGSGSSGHRPGY